MSFHSLFFPERMSETACHARVDRRPFGQLRRWLRRIELVRPLGENRWRVPIHPTDLARRRWRHKLHFDYKQFRIDVTPLTFRGRYLARATIYQRGGGGLDREEIRWSGDWRNTLMAGP